MTEPVFDQRALERSAAGDRTLCAELARLFLSQADRAAARLRGALEPLDCAELRATAHLLQGSAGVVGARRLRAASARLADNIESSPEETARLVARLLTAIDESQNAVAAADF